MPVQTLRVTGDCNSKITRQSAREGGKVVSITGRPTSHSVLLEAESTPGA